VVKKLVGIFALVAATVIAATLWWRSKPSEPAVDVTAAAPEAAAANSGAARSAPAHVAQPHHQAAALPSGTVVRVRTGSTLSSNTNAAGQKFVAYLEEPLVHNGRTIAGRGAEAEGEIVEADKGGRVKGRASLAVRLTRLHTADGHMLAISTNTFTQEAPGTKKKDAAKIGIGSGVGAVIGAIAGGGKGAAIGAGAGAAAGTGVVLATHGDAAVIPSESVLEFRVHTPGA
jgi:hypothetical protein